MDNPELMPMAHFPSNKYGCKHLHSDYITPADSGCDEIEITECLVAVEKNSDDPCCEHFGDHCRFFRKETEEETAERKEKEAKAIVDKVNHDAMKGLALFMRFIIERMDIPGFQVCVEHYRGESACISDVKVADLTEEDKMTLLIDWLSDDDLFAGMSPVETWAQFMEMITDRELVDEMSKRYQAGKISARINLEVNDKCGSW